MNVNMHKTKIVIFLLKRRTKQSQISFGGEQLEITQNYKYLGLDLNEKLE
jgi:hypothetical protein